jgi:hypothetical protein
LFIRPVGPTAHRCDIDRDRARATSPPRKRVGPGTNSPPGMCVASLLENGTEESQKPVRGGRASDHRSQCTETDNMSVLVPVGRRDQCPGGRLS